MPSNSSPLLSEESTRAEELWGQYWSVGCNWWNSVQRVEIWQGKQKWCPKTIKKGCLRWCKEEGSGVCIIERENFGQGPCRERSFFFLPNSNSAEYWSLWNEIISRNFSSSRRPWGELQRECKIRPKMISFEYILFFEIWNLNKKFKNKCSTFKNTFLINKEKLNLIKIKKQKCEKRYIHYF